ncbi:cytochrome c biogenesis protein CcmG, thiol:disulfide interchange protein DsbE [Sphingomonas sp. F9_3S_D5_B_2]
MNIRMIAAAVALVLAASGADASRLKVGQPAPDALLVLANGQRVHLSQLRGQVVVLNYWATWCAPCRTELPLLDGYYVAAAKRGWPLKVFAVATEDSVPKSQLKHLFDVLSISPTDRIRGPFGDVQALPTNYVIDKGGVLRYAHSGAFDLDDLNALLIPLLKEPAPGGQPSTTPN